MVTMGLKRGHENRCEGQMSIYSAAASKNPTNDILAQPIFLLGKPKRETKARAQKASAPLMVVGSKSREIRGFSEKDSCQFPQLGWSYGCSNLNFCHPLNSWTWELTTANFVCVWKKNLPQKNISDRLKFRGSGALPENLFWGCIKF